MGVVGIERPESSEIRSCWGNKQQKVGILDLFTAKITFIWKACSLFGKLVSKLVGALSPFSHKELHHGLFGQPYGQALSETLL